MTGFFGFGDGNYEGMLPNGWDGGSIEGEVEELGKVVKPPVAQMFEMPNS